MFLKRLPGRWFIFTLVIVCACAFIVMTAGTCYASEQEELGTKWQYIVLPELTNRERTQLAVEARRDPDRYLEEAKHKIHTFSEKIEKYIRSWLRGETGPTFPKGFLPPYIDSEKTHSWKLVRPDEIDPQDQWYPMLAYDPKKELHQFSPDPHVTYLKLIFLAPLGAKLLIEGDFPHARFMDYQILSPVDPLHPVTGQMGICEVPIVDVDIEPDPGHVNPFRVGADREAKKRHYHLTFELREGNAVDLNPRALKPPEFRGPGNSRVGGPFAFSGAWGGNVLLPSLLWLRYYAPDKAAGPLGGVPLPKATLQLASGEKFWITCDKSLAVKRQSQLVPVQSTPPMEPYPFIGPSLGWFKMFGIMRLHMEARAYYQSKPWGKKDPVKEKEKIRQLLRIVFNTGPDASPPGNHENSATECNYVSYLSRPMNLGEKKVIVLTGKLPKFPATCNGESPMTKGEIRYFSITHQLGTGHGGYHGTPYGSLMDSELVINKDREYIIVYSREEDRPGNAKPEYGVTWQEWGAPANQTFVVRWMSVRPEWHLPRYAPHEDNLPWETASWSGVAYDKSLVGENRPGALGPYHPVIHYMTRQQFESLGNKRIRPREVPEWTASAGYGVPRHGEVDVEQKVSELRQAFRDLRKARLKRDRKEIATSAARIRDIWDVLPEETRLEIERKSPGITEKIERIP